MNNPFDEFKKVFKVMNVFMTLSGNNVFSETNCEHKRSVALNVQYILLIATPVLIISALQYNSNDFTKIVDSILIAAAWFQIVGKLYILETRYNDMTKFFNNCKAFREKYAEDITNYTGVYDEGFFFRRPILVIAVVLYTYCMDIVTTSSGPFFEKEKALPFPLYLPFGSPFESPYYEITYVLVVCIDSLIAYYMVIFDAIFIIAISEVCLQLNIMKCKLSTLETLERNSLRNAYRMHQDVTQSLNRFNEMFSAMFLVQFASSFVMVSSSLFTVTQNNYSLLVTAVGLTAQLGLYCSYGEILKNKLDNFVLTLTDNQWYDLIPGNRKCLITMLIYGQVSKPLKAGGYMELSLETYLKILKTVYTYLAVMSDYQSSK